MLVKIMAEQRALAENDSNRRSSLFHSWVKDRMGMWVGFDYP